MAVRGWSDSGASCSRAAPLEEVEEGEEEEVGKEEQEM